MSLRALALLLLLVLGLGSALYFSLERDKQVEALQEFPLFPGFDAARVKRITAENVLRDWHARIVRGERGAWQMTDPIAVPASAVRVEHLLASALGKRGVEVPESERDAQKLGFSPPRLVLEIEEEVDGVPRSERVEFGALDADGQRVNVRVRGHYLRVLRDLDTALDRPIDEYKTELALEFQVADVVRVQRRGALVLEGQSAKTSAELELVLEDGAWTSVAPAHLSLDPVVVGTWLQSLAALRHSGYFDELNASLAQFGLAPEPELRLELELRDGSKTALLLGRPEHTEGQVWYGVREGVGILWAFGQPNAWLVGFPLEAMLDHHLLRARNDEVDTLTLRSADGDLYFTREGREWRVAKRRKNEKALDKPVRAERGKVEDLLALLGRVEFEGFRLNQTLEEQPDSPAVWVALGGTTQGGFFGEKVAGKNGSECVLFQRRGENACALAPRELYDAVLRPIDDFWSRMLVEIPEHEQSRLVIEGAGTERRYVRNTKGRWTREGQDAEAKELAQVLDALCFLRAEHYLAPRNDPPWDDKLTIEFVDAVNVLRHIEIGRSREGKAGEEVEIVYDHLRAVAHDQGLHARLLAILRS